MSTPGSPPPRQLDRGREFLADHPVEVIMIDAATPGLLVAVRLPSYRSLPLSCLEEVSLWIDGAPVEKERMQLVLDGHVHRLDELASLPRLWWFILDVGQLRVRLAAPFVRSEVHLRGELVTVEPYISNGRYHFSSSAERTLTVVEGSRGGILHG